jgi:multidrug efflux system outer membrane protein
MTCRWPCRISSLPSWCWVRPSWGIWPDVNASAVATLTRPGSESLNGITATDFLHSKYLNDYNANVSLSWEADIWGKIKNKQSKALAQYLQTEEARKALQTNIVSGVAEGYYNLLMLDAQLGIARANLALNDSTLRIIRLQFNAGDVTALGVQQAEAQEMSAAELIPQLQQSILLQENALSILTGSLPSTITRNITLDQVALRDTLSAGVPAALVSRRPDVRSSELALTAANADVGHQQGGAVSFAGDPAGRGMGQLYFQELVQYPRIAVRNGRRRADAAGVSARKLKTAYRVSEVDREKTVIQFKQTVLVAVGEVSDALAERNKLKEQQAVAATG